jgi:hypothetical protein
MSIKRCLVLLSLLVLPQSARAQSEDAPARSYAHGSVSLLGSASLSAGFFGSSQIGTGFEGTMLTGSFAVRKVLSFGLTVQPVIGLDGFLATSRTGIYAVFAGRAGIGAGWAFALSRSVAFTPMVSYEAAYVGGGISSSIAGAAHFIALEAPLTVFFSRNAFIEIFVRGGMVTAFDQLAPTVASGFRFGVVL